MVEVGRGQPAAGLAYLETAKARLDRIGVFGTDSEGYLRLHRGDALLALGRTREAQAEYRNALSVFEASQDADSVSASHATRGLAETLLADGDVEQATVLLQRALEVQEQAGLSAEKLASVQFLLARALQASDPTRAKTLAITAAASLRAAHRSSDADEIDDWLAKR
jgi:tetratricopeptide (TPR) repeat protein